MAKETVKDFIPWDDVEFTRDNSVQAVKEMFKSIKKTINLNKRTINEQPKHKRIINKQPKPKFKRTSSMISSIGYRGEL